MKKLFLLLLLMTGSWLAQAQDSLNMTRLSVWTSNTANSYNDCWGYSANGREYAIIGSNWGTHFVDITNPTNPVEIASYNGRTINAIWRDFKVYGNYAYGVCDGPGNSSLQIFDLSNLPTSVSKIYDEDSLSTRAHNLFIEGDRLYLPSNKRGGNVYPLEILSLANPELPVRIATMDNTYFGNCGGCLHDVYVKNDTAWCSAGGSGLFIYDLTNPQSPALISAITSYSEQGYNHSSWVNEEYGTMVMADETHGTGLKSFDVSDITNPGELDVFRSNVGALPHNPFIIGTEAIVSYYHDGLRIFDLSDPSNVTPKALYDTYPDNPGNYSGYEGNWGVYPFFASRNIIASDISYGLFVLGKQNDVFAIPSQLEVCAGKSITVPFEIGGTFNAGNTFYLEISDSNGHFVTPTVIDSISGISASTFTSTLPALTAGKPYRVRVRSTNPAVVDQGYTNLIVKDYIYDTTFFNLCLGDTLTLGTHLYYEEGVFLDTVTSPDCDTVFSVTVSVDSVDEPIISQSGNNLLSTPASSYQWYHNGMPVTWGINHSIPLDILGAGTYYVEITQGSCTLISAPFEYDPVGVNALSNAQISIFPNPSSGQLTILNESEVPGTIRIFAADGREVVYAPIDEQQVLQLESGLYLVRFISESASWTGKIVVH